MELELPDVIGGKYRVLRLLGRGAMGAVYTVEHVNTGERLAMKVMSVDTDNPEFVERFRREARATARIASEHVVRVTDADMAAELGGAPFIVMELLTGIDLANLLAERGRLAAYEVLDYLQQAGRGIDRAHAAGIVHRDLVPDNVTVADDGTVKVAGFDLARLLVSDEGEAAALGSPGYMSPEQARGADVTKSADVFSIGVLLYEMATGERPFAGETRAEILDAIAKEAPAAPSVAAVGVPRALDPIVLKCLASDPAARYPDGAALAAALEAVPLPRARRSFPAWIIPVVATIAAVGAVVSGIGAPKPVSRLATRREISSIYRALARAAAAPAPPGSSGP